MPGVGDEATTVPQGLPGPPGGKALLRAVDWLQSRGLGDLAERTALAAVTQEQAPVIRTLAAGGADAAVSSPHVAEPGGAQRAEAVAQTYMDAAPPPGPPTAPGPFWRSIGPWAVTRGAGAPLTVAGRVSAVAVDPGRPAHVLAGAANGGVWESFDRGASWAPRTDYQATLAVGAVAFDPTDNTRVYCGTGEGDWWWWVGAGVLRSLDGGSSWATLCTAPFVGQGFYRIVVDAGDGARLYAGTTGGLYVSADGGTTWVQRRAQRCWSISQVQGGGEILAGCSDGLFASTDNGTTWTAVTLPGAPSSYTRLAVSIAPSNPQVAYAWGSPAGTGATTGLWRRASGTWTAVTPPPHDPKQSWYDWYVAAAPDVDTQLYLGAIAMYRGDLAGGSWTWRVLSDTTHSDQHAVAFEPGNPAVVYAGNDGGLFASADRGATWRSCNNGLGITEFEYFAQDLGTSRYVIGGTQDNGTNRWLGAALWENVVGADGGDCGVNRSTPSTVFETTQSFDPSTGKPYQYLNRSTASGAPGTWANVTPPLPAGEAAGLFYVPVECSASAGNTLAVGGAALYVSRDDGANWARLGYPTAGTASALYCPDPDTVLVGLNDGRILRTRFTSGSWQALTALTTPRANAYVSDLHATIGGGGRLWATSTTLGGGRVFRSDDGGSNWTDVTAGLPALPITAVAVDDHNADRVWVSADVGVYQSLNAGGAWTGYANGLPNAYVGDLIYHPNARVLRAATRNRGVWEIPVDGWLTTPICGTQWTGTLAANQSRRWFTWGWPATWHMLWTVVPTTPAPGAPQLSWTVQTERSNAEWVTYWITVRNLTAQPVGFEGRRAVLSWY